MGVTTSDRRPKNRGIVVPWHRTGDKFGDLPQGPWTGDLPADPLLPRPGNPTLVPDADRRMVTAHAGGGVVPVILGGPLPTGVGIIGGPYEATGHVYLDFLVCEGPIEAIENIKVGGRTLAELGFVAGTHYNIHLGVAGDTTDALMQQAAPAYAVLEYTARLSFKFPFPNQTTGNYTPTEVTCDVKGYLCGGFATATTNTMRQILEAKTNTRWGEGKTISDTGFATAIAGCDVDIDPGAPTTKRWETSFKLDRDAPAPQVIETMRMHCHGNVVFGEAWKAYLDVARSASGIVLRDNAPVPANINCEIFKFETSGQEEVPTVSVVDYTDGSDDYKDASLQYPDPAPAGRYLEQRWNCRGITTRERARRWVQQAHKRAQLDKKITVDALQLGLQLEPGDRIGAVGRHLKSGGAEEDCLVVDVRLLEDRCQVALELYRASTYSDAIDTTGPPAGPPPLDPAATPPNPTGVVAPYANENEYGYLYWNPSDSPLMLGGHYEILDAFGDPGAPPVVKTVLASSQVNAEGKHFAFIPEAIHGDAAHGRTFNVRIRAVTPWPKWSSGVTASWAVGSALQPRVKAFYGRAVSLHKDATSSWATVRGASSADSKSANLVFVRDFKQYPVGGLTQWGIDRSLLAWESIPALLAAQGLSAFPADATIQRIEVDLFVAAALPPGTVTPHVCAAVPYGGFTYPFDVADYNNVGASYASRAFTPTTAEGYYRWLLYDYLTQITAAVGDVNLTSNAFFSVRTANDVNNVEPTLNLLTTNFWASANAGATSPGPKLIITYTSVTEDATNPGGGGGGGGSGAYIAAQASAGPTAQQDASAWGTTFKANEFIGHLPVEWGVKLTGTYNGTNKTFTIPVTPVDGGLLFEDHWFRIPGCDYTRVGATVTMIRAPIAGSELWWVGNK